MQVPPRFTTTEGATNLGRLAPDLAAGPRRLKLAAMRQLAPELLITAKTQRWAPPARFTAVASLG